MAFGTATIVGVAASILDGRQEFGVIGLCLGLFFILLPASFRRVALFALVGLIVGFGLGSVRARDVEQVPPRLEPRASGKIVSDPRLSLRGELADFKWTDESSVRHTSLLFFSNAFSIGRGDTVVVSGRWADESGSIFFADRIDVTQPANTLELRRRQVRARARHRILSQVPGSNGSLALGLFIGDDSGLTAGERDDLRASGLTHITAVSGSNVALVIAAVAFFLRAIRRTGWIWFGIQVAGIIFYVWLVGADPPIVRAAIMGSLALLAGVIGRPAHLFTLLALAGAIMSVLDPNVLHSLGFQLSFLAMIGLGLASEAISRAEGACRKVAVAIVSPAAAALPTAPLIAARFGTLSLGTIPANVIVAPVIVPATMLSGFIGLAPDIPVLVDLAGIVLWLLTGMILAVSGVVGETEIALLTFQPLTNAQTVVLYLTLALVLAPLLPEARMAWYRIRQWALVDPPRATVLSALSIVLLAMFVVLAD